MRSIKALIIAAAVLAPLGFAAAGPLKGHPNLINAQKALDTAYEAITASQKANEFDEGGHAAKAKGFIESAKEQVKLAAETDNHK